MKTLQLPAIELRQNGSRLLVSKMRAGDLGTYTKIDPYSSEKDFADPDQGYQRPPEIARIKKFSKWLQGAAEDRSARMPTAILLSARGTDIVLSPQGTILIKECNKLAVIDGQHRMKGFGYIIDEKGMSEFADYEVPIVILMDIDKIGEMTQFNIVNSTAKSVRTDLVNMILTQMAERVGAEAVKESEHWKVVVSKAVTILNETAGGPWEDQIVMPDCTSYLKEEVAGNPSLRHKRIARATSFMTSLKPIEAYLTEHHSGLGDTLDKRAHRLADLIANFWSAIRQLMPSCFEAADDYVLQKTPGIFTLHMVARHVIRDMYRGHRDWSQEEFKNVLSSAVDALTEPSYWAVGQDEGSRGPGATYYGMKAFSDHAALLYHSRD